MMRIFAFIVLGLTLLSFTGPESRYKKFKDWYSLNSHSFSIAKNSGDFNFQVKVLPKELKVVRAIVSNQNISTKEVKEANEKFDKYHEFNFRIEIPGEKNVLMSAAETEEEHTNMSFYLIESISQDFTLEMESGSKKPLRCSYENNYGAAPYIMLHLIFEKNEDDSMKEIKYSDQLFGNGELTFDLSHIDQLKIPKIK